jgi:hypothetical protein
MLTLSKKVTLTQTYLTAVGPTSGLTAFSSVAELAEKPLYRVTCGHIGTKPEEVEQASYSVLFSVVQTNLLSQYLETVLQLGKIWGCGKL